MPPMRSLQPLLQISTPPWGSRPRPRHAFQIERRLFHGRNSEEEGFPYAIGMSWQTFKREDVLRRLRFPREYTPTLSAIWWTAKHTPRLLVTLVYHGVRLSFWRMQIPQKEKVKSRAGRFFHDVVMQPDCYHQLAMTVKPWGYFGTSTGTSMEPTLSTKNMIFYASYSYVNSYDVSLGDVVIIVRPKCNDGRGTFGKRVAALEGSHIRVNAFRYKTQQKIIIRCLICSISLVGHLADS